MKKTLTLLACLFCIILTQAQEHTIQVYQGNTMLYENAVGNINEIHFAGSPASAVFNALNGQTSIPITSIDSLVFAYYEEPLPTIGDTVYIAYSNDGIIVNNPLSASGVDVMNDGANVTVYSTHSGSYYHVSGNTTDGSLTFYSTHAFHLILDGLNLTSTSRAAVNIASPVHTTVDLIGTSTLSDGAGGGHVAAFYTAGPLTMSPSTGTLVLTGNTKHAINVEGAFVMQGCTLRIPDAHNDAIHAISLTMQGGNIEILDSGSDGIDCSNDFTLNSGTIGIVSTVADVKGIKAENIYINGGGVNINHSGAISKGIKSDGIISISGGSIDITAAGATVIEVIDNQNVPSYCTAIKSDSSIVITGGDIDIDLPTSNNGGKGISADGDIEISGATIEIETHGNGAAYTISGSTKDAYTSSCIKCDGDLTIASGSITCSSTGSGGKGINAGGTMKIGLPDVPDEDLTLNVATSGARITITSGGGWGPGGGGDYANPKAIKSIGAMTINSGTITVNCSQTGEGGECIESKSTMTINGGYIEAHSVADDVINSSSTLTINGGTIYAHSDNNDGIDSNGTMVINGGFVVANGARQPECGFDCDNNQFKVTGGIIFGTGGDTSNPTASVCTQPCLRINTQSGYAIQVLTSSGTVLATYQCPTLSGGGGWGGNGLKLLLSVPGLSTGQTYTVKYGGTITGGTEWHGYYSGNVTYSGGQSTSFTLNSMLTTVSAGGGGW